MAALGKFTQQLNEAIDYQIDFGPWIEDRSDTIQSYVVVADAGIATAHSRVNNVVTVIVSGGTDGTRYKVTVRVTTTGGLVKEADFYVKIKEV